MYKLYFFVCGFHTRNIDCCNRKDGDARNERTFISLSAL